jgi:hypothetical protein
MGRTLFSAHRVDVIYHDFMAVGSSPRIGTQYIVLVSFSWAEHFSLPIE